MFVGKLCRGCGQVWVGSIIHYASVLTMGWNKRGDAGTKGQDEEGEQANGLHGGWRAVR